MIVAIMSDSHDNVPMVRKALDVFRQRGAECLLHAGDFVAPFAVKEVLRWEGPLYAVYGNNDGERAGIRRLIPDVVEGARMVALAGKRIVLVHDREDAPQDLAQTADLLVFGHSHEPAIERGLVTQINPGETGGWLTGRCTVALWDMATNEAEIVEL
jgi:putative phosphoesterase